eukprot:TRINITY_DN64137_c0_g1_i1.p1 TRINITY_DN64137_c0_g1~~TRINITY_DN64137_c0_g1_i1.p1  ORF type:complete len:304 (+),score=93.97 TRINITY_DN64137_c0_g1_i1:123-1034(+)
MIDEAARLRTKCPSEAGQMKAVPPRGPCAGGAGGKRRPRPGSMSRFSPRGPPAPPAQEEQVHPPPQQTSAAAEEELARLRGLVAELTARCERQGAELEAARKRESSSPSQPAAVEVVHAEAQTEPAEEPSSSPATTGVAVTPAAAALSDCEVTRQLDLLHREVGDKSRELRRAQDTVRLLRSELQQQRQVSEQFQAQTEMLEEQLRKSEQLRKEAAAAEASFNSSWSVSSGLRRSAGLGLSRPSSAKVLRPGQEASGGAGRPPDLPSMAASRARRTFCAEGAKSAEEEEEDEEVDAESSQDEV